MVAALARVQRRWLILNLFFCNMALQLLRVSMANVTGGVLIFKIIINKAAGSLQYSLQSISEYRQAVACSVQSHAKPSIP